MSEMLPNLSFLISAKQSADLEYVRRYGDTKWNVNDSGWDQYGADMRFPGTERTLDQIVKEQAIDNDVGMDVAGGTNAVALRELLDSGILSRAIVTNYEDRRSDEVKADQRLRHIDGNLLLPKTWSEIIDTQREIAPQGMGLVLHRPVRILQHLSPAVYNGVANLLVDMLRPGGVLFSQIPSSLNRRTRAAICDDIRTRTDVASVFTSHRLRQPNRHVLILKES